MKRYLIVVLVIIAAAPSLFAERQFANRVAEMTAGPAILGGGVIVGEPTGLTVKLWYAQTGFAIDGAVAWSFVEDPSLYMHASALFNFAARETSGGQFILPYLGIGPVFIAREESTVALRFPVGASVFAFPALPLELFAELAPGLTIVPGTDFAFGAGLGARFYFPI